MEGVNVVKNAQISCSSFLLHSSIPGDIKLARWSWMSLFVPVRLYVGMRVSLFYGFTFSSKDE